MTEWQVTTRLVGYQDALDLMESRVKAITEEEMPELVWLLEHSSMYTAGTSAKTEDLLVNDLFPVFKTGRGGQYTYHGPGQRIIYVMLNLKRRNLCNIRLYIKNLGQWIVNTLKYFAIECKFDGNRIGIWVNSQGSEEKIAAFGVRIRKWVTYHGIAVNISTNLSHYSGIVPCGLKNHGVTSMEKLGINISLTQFDDILKREFYKIFS